MNKIKNFDLNNFRLFKNKKGFLFKIIIILFLVIIILLLWGFIGGEQAQSIGITCDVGLGDTFCWKWHTNIVGEAGEVIGGLIG